MVARLSTPSTVLLAGSGRSGDVPYHVLVNAPEVGDDWLALSAESIEIGPPYEWAVQPQCGAVVTFCGTARDHAPGRSGVSRLTYEAYDGQVVPRLRVVAAEIRKRWTDVGRIALLHRTGDVALGEIAVVVAVSSPHRTEAFEAASFGIDAVKATVPVWKREVWDGGESWGLEAQHLVDADEVP